MHFKRAKMTAKARSAIEMYASINRITFNDVRHDRAAVRGIYAELEASGCKWIPDKQEWAFLNEDITAREMYITLAADEAQGEEALYLLREGFKAIGYEFDEIEQLTVFDGMREARIIRLKVLL